MIKRICVFCGSSTPKNNNLFKDEAKKIGNLIFEKKIELVYGGAKIGIMGIISNQIIDRGGKVIGVIPKILSSKEIINERVDELIIVDSMHERKKKMYELADAFIILPGGVGTLEELSEILTWKVLGLEKNNIYIVNLDGYFNNLIKQFEVMAKIFT